jgi:hypothetical protein
LLTAKRSYLKGPLIDLGSSGLPLDNPIDGSVGGMYRVRSRPLTGKMTGVSDLSQKTPFFVEKRLRWMSRTGGNRAMDKLLVAFRGTLQRGQFLKEMG